MKPSVDVLLPTCNRQESFIMALSGLVEQNTKPMHLIVSDQSEKPCLDSPVVQALLRVFEARHGSVEWHYRVPSRGIAEQRQFLLERSSAPFVLYLDDDVLMQHWVVTALIETLQKERCGFVGAFPAGLTFLDDIRPSQQIIEYWYGPVTPEIVEPGSPEWERFHLHRAANLYHVSLTLPPGELRRYKIAWIASCILYDRQKLLDVGGFSFWSRLPRYHSGEEVLVQNLMMRRWGGCAIIPSGTYYSQLPSTVLNDQGTVDGHALELLPEMAEKYASDQPKSPVINRG